MINSRNIFLSYVDFFANCTGLAGPLPVGLGKKYTVKTDTIREQF